MSRSDAEPTAAAAPAAPPPPTTVTLTIDGTQVTVPKGTNVLEAARKRRRRHQRVLLPPGPLDRGVLPPVPGLDREEPQAAAVVPADRRRGHGGQHHDPQSTLARKQMLEFTLVNHPIDCPICDKAGECTLQKLYFEHDNADSRVDVAQGREAEGRRPRARTSCSTPSAASSARAASASATRSPASTSSR